MTDRPQDSFGTAFRSAYPYLVLTAVCFGVFRRVLTFDFVNWDDGFLVYENPLLNPITGRSFLAFWSALNPLTNSLYGLLALIPGTPGGNVSLNPRAFHCTNLIVHVLTTIVVFRLLEVLTKSRNGACVGAAVFALHPLQVEPVAWVSGLKDVLSGFFAVTALWQYAAHAERARMGQAAGRPYWIATASFVLALCAKSTAVATPVLAAVIDALVVARPWRNILRSLLGWIVVAVVWGIAATVAQRHDAAAMNPLPFERVVVALDALGFYVTKLFVPVNLVADYGRSPESVSAWAYPLPLMGGAVVISVAAAAVLLRSRRTLLICAALLLAGLAPVLGFLRFGHQAFSTVADRYMYLPMLAPAFGVAQLASRSPASGFWIGALVALSLLGVRSARQVHHWSDSRALHLHTLAVNPRSWQAHTNLAASLLEEGKTAEAVGHLEAALKINPNCAAAHNNLGRVLLQQGLTDQAIAHWREALRADPSFAHTYYNLANAFAKQRNDADAILHYREAIARDPSFADAYYNLGNLYLVRGEDQLAIANYRAALRIRESADVHNNLAAALFRQGLVDEAIAEYRAALTLQPNLREAQFGLRAVLTAKGH